MSQSLYTAMSGISAATTELEVISNNIANINTTAYKSSSVEFSDVFSRTLSSGSVATDSTGGTNPIQVGVGTQVSAVTKDFSTGSWVATGSDTDLMIEGSGFFTVKSSDGSTYYTRAGDFSFDSHGNLVTSEGYQVLGTDSIMSNKSSTTTVTVPLSICADVTGTDTATLSAEKLSDLNGISKNITNGSFTVQVTDSTGKIYTGTVKLTIDANTTVAELQNQLQTGMTFTDTSTGDSIKGIAVSLDQGKLKIDTSAAEVDNPSGTKIANVSSLSFSAPKDPTVDVTNFLTATGLGSGGKPIVNGTDKYYETNVLDYTARISQLSSASQSISETAETINADGSVQVTYNDGSVLSVQLSADKSHYEFVYTTSNNAQISGNKCNVDADVAEPANFVIQLATITNKDGLLSEGNNLFQAGPNSGAIVYTVGNQMGAGKLQSGGLEASNVDLSDQLSNMILAQRAIEANSRVFTTTSDVMSTIVQMGR